MKSKENFLPKANILWIEGKRAESPSFVPDLRRKGFTVDTVPTGKAALERLTEVSIDVVVVDAASFRTSGKRICQDLRQEWEKLPILLVANPERPVSKDTCADVVLNLPFTLRKLVNRILPLLPAESNNLLHAGPITLDLERKSVRCGEKETRLTPRMTHLLRVFLKHPGEVLERGSPFREIWNTEYTGDTRTLDVHISWLRQAIEVDPRRPRFLRTIRGVGYRLDT